MKRGAGSGLERKIASFSSLIGIAVSVAGCLVLVGWMQDIAALKSVFAGLPAMRVNSAACFALGGAGLWLARQSEAKPGESWQPWLVRFAAIGILLFSLLTLAEYAFGWDLGIDLLLAHGSSGAPGEAFPGRMPIMNAINFALLSLALLLINLETRTGGRATTWFALTIAANAYLAILGYLYGVVELQRISARSPSMALHSATLFVLLGLGLICARPEARLVRKILDVGPAGLLIRRVLPVAIVVPPLLGAFEWSGEVAGYYEGAFGHALFAATIVILFVALTWWIARALGSQHSRLNSILENEPECVKLLAPDGSLLEMNPAGLRMIEADSLEQVRGKQLYNVIVEKHRGAFRVLSEKVLAGGTGLLEFEIIGLKGGRRWLETNAAPLRDSAGRVESILGITRDITARKADHEALRESARRLENLLESIGDAFLSLDSRWQFRYTNENAARTLGRTREQLLGKDIWSEFPQFVGRPFYHAYRKAMDERVFVFVEDRYEATDTWYENRIYPVDGGITVFVTDISERKRAERSLALSQERLVQQHSELEQLYQTAPVGLALLDTDLRFVRINDRLAAIDGVSRQAHIGKSIEEIVPELAGKLRPLYQRVIDTGEALMDVEIDGQAPAEPDVTRNWLASYLPIRATDGKVVGVSAIVTDVTDRKRAEIERADLLAREREARRQLDRILESVSDAFVALDSRWRYTYVNQRAGQILQRRPEDLIGKHIWTEFPEAVGDGFKDACEKAFAEQVPQAIEEFYAPYGLWFENRIYPHPDGVSIVFQDITARKQAEDVVRRSEERLRTVLDGLGPHMLVGLMDTQGIVLMANDPARTIAELGKEDVVGRPVEDTYWWNYSEESILRLRASVQAAASGQTVRYDTRIRIGDGKFTWIDFSIVPLRNEEGKVTLLLPSAIVINERKQAEEALRNEDRLLRLIVEHSPAAIAMFDRDLNYIVTSRRYPAAYGLEDEELAGRSLYDAFPEVSEHWRQALQRCLAGATERAEEDMLEHADGRIEWVRWEVCPWHESSGRVGGVILFSEIVTERKQASLALQANERQLRLIFENVEDVVFMLDVVDKGFRFASVNERFLSATGLASEQVIGKTVDQVIPEPALSKVLERYSRAMHTGEPVHWEETSSYPSGTRHGEVTVAPVMDESGRCIQLIGTVHDVTQRVESRQELREAALRQEALARRLVDVQEAEHRHLSAELHDRIGQSLTAISINLNIMGNRHTDATTKAARLLESRRLLESTISTVRDLIAELRPTVLDDYGLLAGLRWFGEQIRERTGLKVHVVGDEPTPRLESRVESALFRIAQEALNNIVKHAQASKATLSLSATCGNVALEIADDGCGFEDSGANPTSLGGHWGLQIMRERAESVGARFRVESVPGAGTRVVIDLGKTQ